MTTDKKILIGLGIGVGVWAVFILKGLDGRTLWQRKFGKQTPPKEPKQPTTSNVTGFPPDNQGKCPRGYKLGGDKLCHQINIYNANGESERTFRVRNIRASIVPANNR